MKRYLLTATAALCIAGSASAQQQQQQQQQQQAGPKVKSQKELEALQKVQGATDPQQRLQAIDNVLENFTDTNSHPSAARWRQNCRHKSVSSAKTRKNPAAPQPPCTAAG
jgi:hypothetical protein